MSSPRSGKHGVRAIRKHGPGAYKFIVIVVVICLGLSAVSIVALRNVGKPLPKQNSQSLR